MNTGRRGLPSASKYWEAMRTMQPRQILARARRGVPPALLEIGCRAGRPAGWRPLTAGWHADPAPQSGPLPAPDGDRRFRAFGVERSFDVERFWVDDSDGLLFTFHLHGFSELAAYASGSRSPTASRFWAEVTEDWLASNSAPSAPGWHPYPTSERVIAWALAISAIKEWPESLRERVAAELWRQARYLARTVERDIGGNHVIRNATAITLAGVLYPDSNLLRRGMELLHQQLEQQILSDGGHEERSTSYHRRIAGELSRLSSVLETDGPGAPAWLNRAIAEMHDWQRTIAGPDGTLPSLNDAWEGPPLSAAPRPPAGFRHFAASGYIVLSSGGDHAVLDVGPICPPHLPAHAHADVLSFVLWADGRPALIDPGTYLYSGVWRDHFRSTAAHSTVEVDGFDQCEFWGDFRASYAPRVSTGPPVSVAGATLVNAAHDGYRRLPDPALHRRTFIWMPDQGIVVIDRIESRRPHSIRSTLRPPAAWTPGEPHRIGPLTVVPLGDGAFAQVRADHVSPYLGSMLPASAIDYRLDVEPGQLFGWSLLREPAEVTHLDTTQVTVRSGDGAVTRLPLSWSAPAPG